MPGPLPGSGGTGGTTTGFIGKQQPRGFLPNIFSGFGGGLGGGYGAFDPTFRKKRPLFAQGSAPQPGIGGTTIPGEGPAPDNYLRPNPLKLNIYEEYPGFNPLYRGDQLGGIEKQRGSGPETLQRLSEATMAYRGRGRGFSGIGGPGAGYGEGLMPDPLKRLLMARYGGGI